MKPPVRLLRGIALMSVTIIAAHGFASVLVMNDPSPTYFVSNGEISVFAFTPELIDTGPTLTFQNAFDNWNSSLPPESQWTLSYVGQLGGGFSIETYDVYLAGNVGGVEVHIHYNNGPGDPPKIGANGNNTYEAGWTQGVLTTVKLAGSLPGNPYLDNPLGAGGFPPPLYPYNYVDSSFYDKPGRSPNAWWYAEAYLVSANYGTRFLALYDGVSWGFEIVIAPEPSIILLMVAGSVVCWILYKRRLVHERCS